MNAYIPLILSAVLLCSSNVSAEETEHLFLNGNQINCIISGDNVDNLQLSTRNFFESAGFTVQWFSNENRVTAFNSDINITMYPNSQYVYINGIEYTTDKGMEILNGTSVIPLSLAVSALNGEIKVSGNDIYFSTNLAVDSTGWQYDVLDLVNEEREKYGLTPLIWNSDLASAAYLHCKDMADRGYFAHNTPEGLTPFDRLHELGIQYTVAAENIAAGQPDPKSVVDAWMNSPGHRANILNEKVKEIGIAYVRGGTYGIYWAQEFASIR